jgi:hypothetical protein
MNAASIRFRCPRCNARIKAPAELSGRRRDCPACRRPLVVRRDVPRDSDPVLVLVERDGHCALDVAYRRGA